MILVDTSVWIDHLHTAEPDLVALLEAGSVAVHPAVIGELALGRIADREIVLGALGRLAAPVAARDAEVLQLIEHHRLAGSGIGWADAHLLASARLTAGSSVWTRDRRLRAAAQRLGVAAPLT